MPTLLRTGTLFGSRPFRSIIAANLISGFLCLHKPPAVISYARKVANSGLRHDLLNRANVGGGAFEVEH